MTKINLIKCVLVRTSTRATRYKSEWMLRSVLAKSKRVCAFFYRWTFNRRRQQSAYRCVFYFYERFKLNADNTVSGNCA